MKVNNENTILKPFTFTQINQSLIEIASLNKLADLLSNIII